jgi:hypothetical protein
MKEKRKEDAIRTRKSEKGETQGKEKYVRVLTALWILYVM